MIWNDIQKRLKKETEKQYSIFKKTRGQKERKTAVKVLYRKRTTTLHKCHWTLHLQRMLDIGFSMSVRCFTSSVLFFFSFSLIQHSAFPLHMCFKTDWMSACFIAPCALWVKLSLSTCHKRAFWVFVTSHMSMQCRLFYRFGPTVEVCSPPQCSCRESHELPASEHVVKSCLNLLRVPFFLLYILVMYLR